MHSPLRIITAQPNDLYFNWQLRVQLHNLRKYGLSEGYTALILYHDRRAGKETFFKEWEKLKMDFPEATFVYYDDAESELARMSQMFNYIPLLRPWMLKQFFKANADYGKEPFLYMDSDVVFTKRPSFERLLEDDICYLSDTRSYIAASYFDSKEKDVLPERLEAYRKIDVLQDLMKQFDLSRQIAMDNEEGSGGAQYLLKNIDHKFWEDVYAGCMSIKLYFSNINQRFFEGEDKGFQSWCADMWSILYNLWRRGYKTACPPEMDFCWATDPIEKWEKVQIYHDAGATSRNHEGAILFHKRESKYINNLGTPFEDDLSAVSDKYCSKNYVREIEEIKKEQWEAGLRIWKETPVQFFTK